MGTKKPAAARASHSSRRDRTILVIGGHEDKTGEMKILREVSKLAGKGKFVITTVATSLPEDLFSEYIELFSKLGLKNIAHLEIPTRVAAQDPAILELLREATAVFFTGGDQLRITSQIGGTPIAERLREIYEAGGLIAGTSAGASVICETMLVSGRANETPRLGDMVEMAPGLGLIGNVVIDQHFAERGRMTRLLAAIAQNPRLLGIGIDEDTAVAITGGAEFHVLGSGAVYVIDAHDVTFSNIAEKDPDLTLAVHDLRLHVLSAGDSFHLETRRPRTGATAE